MLHHHFATAARRSRFQLAVTITALALIVGAGPAAGTAARPTAESAAAPTAYDPNAVNVGWTRVITGLSKPVLVTHAGDGSGRLFVVQQGGKIRVFKGGVLLAASFLDLSASVATGSEQGLLGLAFHPSFETNGKFYVYLTLKSSGANVVNEYRVAAPYTADTAAWQTGRRILTMTDPYSNHNGGHMAFGPDGYLYIGTGDGGSGGDPGNRAQSTTSLLGKLLRIDIDGLGANGVQYRIPATNPYVGVAGWDEIWARGLRNPWRWSFDRANGDLWIGDVGQNLYEEVDVSRAVSGLNAGRGANYGWRVMEGRHCYNPSSGCSTSGKVLPLVEYSHASGCSVTGGYVYRGTAEPELVGAYLFGDYCSGKLWSINAAGTAYPAPRVQHQDSALNISSFGEDEAGNVYIVFIAGVVYRITASPK